MNKSKKVDKYISAENSSWTFGKNVPKTFTKHINKSVPFYNNGHDLICELSDFFLKNKSIFYDIGCYKETLINRIYERHKNKLRRFLAKLC